MFTGKRNGHCTGGNESKHQKPRSLQWTASFSRSVHVLQASSHMDDLLFPTPKRSAAPPSHATRSPRKAARWQLSNSRVAQRCSSRGAAACKHWQVVRVPGAYRGHLCWTRARPLEGACEDDSSSKQRSFWARGGAAIPTTHIQFAPPTHVHHPRGSKCTDTCV